MNRHATNPETSETETAAPASNGGNAAIVQFLGRFAPPNGSEMLPLLVELVDRVRWDVLVSTGARDGAGQLKYEGTYEKNSGKALIEKREKSRAAIFAAMAANADATVQTEGASLIGSKYVDLIINKAREVLPAKLYKTRKTAASVTAEQAGSELGA